MGSAVSLGVGALFWPRGAGALMRRSLATSYARSADYLAAAIQQLMRGDDALCSRRQARAAANRLDDAFRQYLGELSGNRAKLEDLATLLAGTTRLRLAAYSVSALVGLLDGSSGRERYMRARLTTRDVGSVPGTWRLAKRSSMPVCRRRLTRAITRIPFGF